MNKFFTKKRSKSIMIWICILFLIYLYIKPHIVSTYETHILTELKVVDNGEINLIAENEYSSLEIKDLIPKEYQDYDYIDKHSIVLNDDTMYFITYIHYGGLAMDLFSFNMKTSEVTHISDLSDLKFCVENLYVINDNIYFDGDYEATNSLAAFFIDGKEAVSLSNSFYLGSAEYDNGLAIAEFDITGAYISKYVGNEKTRLLNFPIKAYPDSFFTGKTISWYSNGYVSSNHQYFFYTFINNDVEQISIPENHRLVAMQNFYILQDHTLHHKIIKIMNYEGEEIATISGEELDILGRNHIDSFIYKDSTSLETFLVKIDAATNTMYTTELIFSNSTNRYTDYWMFSEDSLLYLYDGGDEPAFWYYFFENIT